MEIEFCSQETTSLGQRFKYVLVGGVLFSAATAIAFCFATQATFDSSAPMKFIAAPLVILSVPGVLVGVILSGGIRSGVEAGGMWWKVAAIAFVVNAIVYCGVIGLIVAIANRLRSLIKRY